jgi:hypothetical protein
VPQYIADPRRLTSISKIAPLPAEINETWREVPYPYVSKYQGPNEWRKRRATRREARVRVKGEQAWYHALARRSAVILALGLGVDAVELPHRWPAITLIKSAHLECVTFPLVIVRTSHTSTRRQYVHQTPPLRRLSSMIPLTPRRSMWRWLCALITTQRPR